MSSSVTVYHAVSAYKWATVNNKTVWELKHINLMDISDRGTDSGQGQNWQPRKQKRRERQASTVKQLGSILEPVELHDERGVVWRVGGARQRSVLAHNGLNESENNRSRQ